MKRIDAKNEPDELAVFARLLRKKNLKMTRERRLILEEVVKLKSHFDADNLFERLKKKDFPVSRDTVFRNIPLLLECGVIQKSVGKGRGEYFERTKLRGHHDHMVCISCRKVIEFHSGEIERLQETECEKHRFHLVFHDHRLFGYCESCQEKTPLTQRIRGLLD